MSVGKSVRGFIGLFGVVFVSVSVLSRLACAVTLSCLVLWISM